LDIGKGDFHPYLGDPEESGRLSVRKGKGNSNPYFIEEQTEPQTLVNLNGAQIL
jgi:hypothetical protein